MRPSLYRIANHVFLNPHVLHSAGSTLRFLDHPVCTYFGRVVAPRLFSGERVDSAIDL